MALTLIRPHRHADARGWFSETYSTRHFEAIGLDIRFVQDNQSLSRNAGTVRGLHFQRPPAAQAKLIGCLSGRLLDYVVDIRLGSPTFGKTLTVELTEAGEQLFVPVGFAHGFVTLTADVRAVYKVSSPYDRDAEGGIAWNDPAISVDWPLPGVERTISDKDAALPPLSQLASPFAYDGEPMGLREV
ncbi:dTDP-4-dehydrorhamnose 3,5-epimerase [Brevundimonas sp.]|uniref:dTDP-4-dehydrorhamnose 3,5-epimerase n=1 Tax=Brevundimonas sp. TaxID=1871086 RepID=UPI00286CB8FB|nr:dTDP-4-dehydrorhamnose 3,5-epimerase [Brevundimonas sp.]